MVDRPVVDKPVVGKPVVGIQEQDKVGCTQAGLHKQVHSQLLGVQLDLCVTFAVEEGPAWARTFHPAYQVPLCVASACMRKRCSIQH